MGVVSDESESGVCLRTGTGVSDQYLKSDVIRVLKTSF